MHSRSRLWSSLVCKFLNWEQLLVLFLHIADGLVMNTPGYNKLIKLPFNNSNRFCFQFLQGSVNVALTTYCRSSLGKECLVTSLTCFFVSREDLVHLSTFQILFSLDIYTQDLLIICIRYHVNHVFLLMIAWIIIYQLMNLFYLQPECYRTVNLWHLIWRLSCL